ncbi:MAG: glycosyltransferase [Patescibacteria group bacterium]
MWTNGTRMPTNGNVEPLRDFLVPRVKRLVLIDQPHPGSEVVMPIIEEYSNQQLKYVSHSSSWWMFLLLPFLKLTNFQGTQLFFKIRDFFSVFDWTLMNKFKYDYFIGLECINTLAGIILKKLGKVNKVIYYVLDYSPSRYKGIFNKIYLFLDQYCAVHADYIWDVSKAMQPARIALGLDEKKSSPVIHVPIGIYPQQLLSAPINKRLPFSLVYMGTLGEESGPDLAIEAMPLVLKKFAKTTLHVIGGGQKNLERLKNLVKSLGIESKVVFYGYVVKNIDMAEILSHCYVAVAPYRDFPDSTRKYADASKMRSYAAAGLPIITTAVPPLGKNLQEIGGSIIAPDNKEGLTDAVITLFSSPILYVKMHKVLLKFAKVNTWDNEFSKAFSKSQ